ncbi:amino acid permease [Weissella soli]|uniref:Lysine:proton symporter (AAT family) n=2 Tax=Weissella soli TaxID=155866 RepID=A0A288QWB5_9LACO|nr:amino acid permease [Weissella soli]AOT56101.1 putative amino-acid permease [Weissella soli]NKY82560.1 amino acid permease [Weissella soli]RDL11675.1 lysine:proton symporter (AAT family) [Weissella soli]GEN93098.1 amino acid transporter [Weissella soli]
MSQESNGLRRTLKTRHLSMIALGGTIGTGLFLSSGATISQAGPLGALTAYAVMGAMVFFLMTSLGEMATHNPVSGSFSVYADKYVEPAFGFAMGWNYWFNWAITVAVEAATVGVVMQYWWPSIPGWIWAGAVLLLITLINLFSARAYGETEFWMALIKVIAVILFMIVGVLTILGIMGNQPDVANNLSADGHHGFIGGAAGILSVFMVAGFSFQGTEMVGITAGESETPETSVPKAISQVFWRILLFYILAIFIIGAIINYKDPSLLKASESNVAVSPFTLVFKQAGFALAASVMNAVILTSVISSANSGVYASSRMLWSMAQKGMAPKIFGKTNTRTGIPVPALLLTVAVGLFSFLTSVLGPDIYYYLVAASGLTGFIAWIGIAVSHYRFRRAWIKQGHSVSELRYHAKWFPFGPILALILSFVVVIGQDTSSFAGSITHWNWEAIITTYMSVPLFLVLYFSYKIKNKSRVRKLEDIDLSSSHSDVE